MEIFEAHYGQVIYNATHNVLLKVHHVDNMGMVYYFVYTLFSDSEEDYDFIHSFSPDAYTKYWNLGTIWDFQPATPEQRFWLEHWIINHNDI